MKRIAFDVDGTLIDLSTDQPKVSVIRLLESFNQMEKCQVFVWSGGGTDYAKMWLNRLGVNAMVIEKGSIDMDVCFDDEEVALAKVNIRV